MSTKYRPDRKKTEVWLQGTYIGIYSDEKTAYAIDGTGHRMLAMGVPIAQVKAELRGRSADAVSFRQYFSEWSDSRSVRPSTKLNYDNAFERIPERIQNLPINRIGRQELKAIIEHLKAKKYKATTIHSTMGALKAALNEAFRDGLTDSAAATRLPNMPTKKPENPGWALTREQHKELIKHTPERFETLFTVWPFIGARTGEILALRKDDVVGRRVFIRRQRRLGKITPTKNNVERWVDLPAPIAEILQQHIASTPGEFLFPRQDGQMYSDKYALDKALRDAAAEAGIENMHPHIFRHTMGSWMLDAKETIPYVAARLGDTITTLTKTYAHEINNQEEAAIERFEEWLKGDTEVTAKSA